MKLLNPTMGLAFLLLLACDTKEPSVGGPGVPCTTVLQNGKPLVLCGKVIQLKAGYDYTSGRSAKCFIRIEKDGSRVVRCK
jgi:hypothetical protein